MFSLFRRKVSRSCEQTFKARVDDFWRWYTNVAPRFYQTLDGKKSPTLASEVSAKVNGLISGCAWVFGPGPNGTGHSFTLTGEGNPHHQLLAEYWRNQAPPLEGWTFYSSRQPSSDLNDWRLEIGGECFDPLEFWLAPSLDRERQQIDMTVWHPLFSKMAESDRWTVIFLVLDEALGEFGTQSWISQIKMTDSRLADAMPLKELPAFVSSTEVETGWKKYAPTDTWTGYQMKEPHDRFRRGDIIAGTTCNMTLLDEFLQSEDRLEDPLAQTGADYVFVKFDASILPEGKQVEVRAKIEDALQESLLSAKSGRHLGGALGIRFAYIDLMIFDGGSSLDLIRETLCGQSLPKGTSVEFFAKVKRDQPIVL